MQKLTEFSWAVIGAGPAGMTAVGKLLDQGIPGESIVWIDPAFQAGDFGKLWGEVNSNTRVALFRQFLNDINSFDYQERPTQFPFDALDNSEFTTLKTVTEPLLFATESLKKKVVAQQTLVKSMRMHLGTWELATSDGGIVRAEKVILAMGSEPRSLSYPGSKIVDLVTALTPSKLRFVCKPTDTVAVFGSSHSAMIAIRNLVEAGVQNIVNFYVSPLRFAVLMDDWIFYDDSGLKGETAAWVKQHILKQPLSQIQRYISNDEHLEMYLPTCNKVIYAVGFQARQVPVQGVSLIHYDETNGIIAPGLFGLGIGYPIAVTDPFGRTEYNVGLWKFLKNIQKLLPVWQKYGT